MRSTLCLLIAKWSDEPFDRKWTKTDRSERLPSAIFVHFREFATEHLVWSNWTQKTFDRAFKELSNGIHKNEIRPKTTAQLIYFESAIKWRQVQNAQRPSDASGKWNGLIIGYCRCLVCQLNAFSYSVPETGRCGFWLVQRSQVNIPFC